MQRLFVICGAVAALAAATAADATELRATLGGWSYDLEGTVDDRGVRYDFDDDLELRARRGHSVAVELDTPRGAWPDFAASYTPIAARGDHSEEVGLPFPTTRTITTDADFDVWEAVARYPLNRGPLRLSAGVAVQQLKGELVIDDSEEGLRHERYDETFPLLHAQLRMAGKAFGLKAVGQGVSYQGSSALQLRALLEVRFMQPLLIEAGWQQSRYEIELSDYALDTRVSGAVVRVGLIIR